MICEASHQVTGDSVCRRSVLRENSRPLPFDDNNVHLQELDCAVALSIDADADFLPETPSRPSVDTLQIELSAATTNITTTTNTNTNNTHPHDIRVCLPRAAYCSGTQSMLSTPLSACATPSVFDMPPDTPSIRCDRSGTSAVVKIMQPESSPPVAIKTVVETTDEKRAAAAREVAFARLLEETPSVSSPHLVQILEVSSSGACQTTRVAMEYLPGGNVAEYVASLRAPADLLPPSAAGPTDAIDAATSVCERAVVESALVGIARDVLQGLSTLHTKLGVIHRDITPANLLISADGTVKIIDFGMSSLGLAADDQVGSAPYMAPERLRGEVHGPASDVWSLGVVLLQLALGGRHPFLGDASSTSKSICVDPFWATAGALRATAPASECAKATRAIVLEAICAADLSEEFGQMVQQMLASDATQRPTVDTLLQHLWLQ